MDTYQRIAQTIEDGLRKSVPVTRAVLQAIQLGYSLAKMEEERREQKQ